MSNPLNNENKYFVMFNKYVNN